MPGLNQYTSSWPLAACLLISIASPLPATNRFHLSGGPVLAGSSAQELLLQADSDINVYGFSFGIHYDPARLTATAVLSEGTLAAGADFFAGEIDTNDGLLGYGCVFDFFDDERPPGTDFLRPGADQPIAKVIVSALATEDTTTTLSFEDVAINSLRPVKNIMTNEQGFSEVPELVNLILAIETRRPRIVSLSGNSGLAGTVFTVTGDLFGEPGLAVQVCGGPAEGALQADGMTLLVTAPACAGDGFAPIQVCTVRGCDSRSDGFFYETPPPPPGKFIRGDCNADGAVSGVVTDAVFMLNFNFLGGPDPPCAAACDANGDEAFPGTVTDAVYVLNFNFLGGPPPRPPYPDCDPGNSPGDLSLGCVTPLTVCQP